MSDSINSRATWVLNFSANRMKEFVDQHPHRLPSRPNLTNIKTDGAPTGRYLRVPRRFLAVIKHSRDNSRRMVTRRHASSYRSFAQRTAWLKLIQRQEHMPWPRQVVSASPPPQSTQPLAQSRSAASQARSRHLAVAPTAGLTDKPETRRQKSRNVMVWHQACRTFLIMSKRP